MDDYICNMIRLPLLVLLTILLLNSCKKGEISADEVKIDVPQTVSQSENTLEVDSERRRYAWQKPELVIERLGNIEGKIIADIGAGTGYFSFRLIRQAKKVIAVDIDPNMINLIEIFKENLDSIQQPKIETRLATADNPLLGNEEVDVVIIINTIGYIQDRRAYLNNLKRSLKPGGEIMIVDFKMKRIPDDIAPPMEYRVNLLTLENLLTELGYHTIDTDDRSLEYQFIVKAHKGQ